LFNGSDQSIAPEEAGLMPRDCLCKEKMLPLASFCGDDLFCPQCGARVAWLDSPNELPNPDPARLTAAFPALDAQDGAARLLWVYASELGRGNRFTFRLEYRALNKNHTEESRKLILNEDLCEVVPLNWPYGFRLELAESHEQREVHVRLKPDPLLAQEFGESEWFTQVGLLPPEGVFCTLTVVGNCGSETFGLLVLGEPRYEVEVYEDDQRVLDSPPEDAPESVTQAWALSRRGPHELTMLIRCINGFVHLPPLLVEGQDQNPAVRGPEKGNFTVGSKSLPAERILGSKSEPCKIVVGIDSEDWSQGKLQGVNVNFSLDVLGSEQVPIYLYLEPRGEVGFDPPNTLRIRRMFYGERISSTPEGAEGALFSHAKIFNRGEQKLKIRRPFVERITLPEVDWIKVGWQVGGKPLGAQTDLEVGKSIGVDVDVTIDLTQVTPANHQGGPLWAKIWVKSLQDDRLPWDLDVMVESVVERPALESPLAIDFGNTNTYAVIFGLDARPVPALGEEDPENFPTSLFLKDVPDPTLSTVLIGGDAVTEGKNYPESMVWSPLKRWLLLDADEWEAKWPIFVPTRGPLQFKRSELIRLFLEKVILKCEKAQRRTVTRVGLSYPANFSPRARKRFDEIIADLEGRRKAVYPHLERRIKIERVSTIDSSPDEASAVAIGFVHDEDRFWSEIGPQGLNQNDTFLVASFDFGGGSIDCALLRFTLVGTRDVPRFESVHLSFGGDERFGGDNVTRAVFQILVDRFGKLLSEQDPPLEFPVARTTEAADVGSDRWNHQHVWALAEELKRYLCQPGPSTRDQAVSQNETVVSTPAAPGQAFPAEESPALERLGPAVQEFLNRVHVRDSLSKQVAKLSDALSDARSLPASFLTTIREITLDQVYSHEFRLDRDSNRIYTVRDRVRKSIGQLHDFVSQARMSQANERLFIVLAGAACRLPLVRQLLEKTDDFPEFKGAGLVGDPLREPNTKPKSKVAFGLAQYLEIRVLAPGMVRGLCSAGNYTHGRILWRRGPREFKEWVPSCFPLRDGRWHELKGVSLGLCLRDGKKIDVYHDAYPPEKIGSFDLSQPATDGGPLMQKELPELIDDGEERSKVFLRVFGAEDELHLKVQYRTDDSDNWGEYGYWRLIPVQ
jgi:hypothetical protein